MSNSARSVPTAITPNFSARLMSSLPTLPLAPVSFILGCGADMPSTLTFRQACRSDVCEPHTGRVFCGELRLDARPLDTNVRDVPEHADLGLRRVIVGALVSKQRRLTRDQKAVREAGRHVELTRVLGRQYDAFPPPD